MNKSIVRKKLVFLIIILIVGSYVIPSMGEIILNRIDQNFINPSLVGFNSKGFFFYVGGSGPGNYTKIQYAIDNASDGDTIFVFDDSSPYYENVIIDKPINLFGENRETTTIDGNYSEITIYVKASYVNIKGFCIMNGNLSGIRLWKSEGCSITDNIIDSNKRYGIYLSESNSNNISGNVINVNYYAIILNSKSNLNTIKSNYIFSNENGIYLEYSSENIIAENTISNNNYGLKLYSKSRYNKIEGNIISNNTNGIFIGGSIFPTFILNILLDGSTHNKIIKNIFVDNEQDAFFQNSRKNRWWRNYWNHSQILPKLIFGEIFICRLQGIPPTTIELHVPWIPKIDWHPALKPFLI